MVQASLAFDSPSGKKNAPPQHEGSANFAEIRLSDIPPGDFTSRMYAVAFDLDIESLRLHYGDPYNNAYSDIKRHMLAEGFAWQQGSVYFGGEKINAVTCVLAVSKLSRKYPWFAKSVRDIRMLRIEELNDLMPAVNDGNRDRSTVQEDAVPDGENLI